MFLPMPISHTCWNSVCSAPNTISMPSGSLNSAFPTHIFSAPFNSFLFRNSISTWPCPLRRWGHCETCPHWWYPCYSTGNRVPHLQTLKRSKDDGGVSVVSTWAEWDVWKGMDAAEKSYSLPPSSFCLFFCFFLKWAAWPLSPAAIAHHLSTL